ncbi:MAG: TonB-dependent receptor [Rickettsiales bacterium]|jgi:vitamin B12 transporter|nr:TonB-dependent receptor [Rickettsiales bacterium]
MFRFHCHSRASGNPVVAAAIFLAVFSSAPAFAQTTIPPIIVTATRTPANLTQIASSVTVINEEEIRRKNKQTVVELLRDVPGLNLVQSGGVGQNTRVFTRGTNSNHTLVMMDGVALNDPSDTANAYDFSNLTTDNIERIEILRGAQSTLYGSQAIGGVINIITKKGKGVPRHSAFIEVGRYSSAKLGASSLGEVGDTSYSVSASGSRTDGISAFSKEFGGREKDGNETYSLGANLAQRINESFTAKLNARYNRTSTEFDSPGSIPNFGLRPDDDLQPDADNRQINMRASGEWVSAGGEWSQELGVSVVDINRSLITEYFDALFNPLFGRRDYEGQRRVLDWVHRIRHFRHHDITAGIEFATEDFRTDGLKRVDVDNRAFFANDQFIYGDAFMNAGVRLDEHQQFGRVFTYKLAPGYRINATGTTLKASYGTGFKAPSLSQLYDPSSGNRNLGSERSKSLDAGFEQSLYDGKLVVGATAFRNYIDDLIGFGPSPLFLTLNVGKARTQGFEWNIIARPHSDLDLSANYTFTSAENRRNGTWLLRRPKHLANIGATYRVSADSDLGMNLRYVGASRDFLYSSGSGAKTTLASFATFDLSANHRLTPEMSVYGRLDNLLDKRYEEISGFGQPGRGLYVGVKSGF